jgi:hypothetical protein
MIDGNFNYKYKGKKYSGKANKGILEWLEVDGNTVKRYEFPKKENSVLQDHSINNGHYESYLSLEGIALSSEQIDLPYIYFENQGTYKTMFWHYTENPCEFLRAKENQMIEMMEAQGEDPDLIPVE